MVYVMSVVFEGVHSVGTNLTASCVLPKKVSLHDTLQPKVCTVCNYL